MANRAAKHDVFLVLAGANQGVAKEIAAYHAADRARLAPDMTNGHRHGAQSDQLKSSIARQDTIRRPCPINMGLDVDDDFFALLDTTLDRGGGHVRQQHVRP